MDKLIGAGWDTLMIPLALAGARSGPFLGYSVLSLGDYYDHPDRIAASNLRATLYDIDMSLAYG